MSPVTGLDGVGVCAQWHQHGPFTNETASNPSEVIYSFITWSESQWGIWNGTTRMDDITDDLPSLRTVGLLELHWHWLLCNRQHAVRGFYWSQQTPNFERFFRPFFFLVISLLEPNSIESICEAWTFSLKMQFGMVIPEETCVSTLLCVECTSATQVMFLKDKEKNEADFSNLPLNKMKSSTVKQGHAKTLL